MKAIFWLLVILLAALCGYLIVQVARSRREQVARLSPTMTLDSIAAYQERVEQLKSAVVRLREKAAAAGRLERLRLERDIDRLELEIRDLLAAIEQWRSAVGNAAQADIYHRCILLYGRASGICDVLLSDTLTEPAR
ncbi:MAG: hypothetical protein ABIK43_00665 [candidate division WOR-3 bacterium]